MRVYSEDDITILFSVIGTQLEDILLSDQHQNIIGIHLDAFRNTLEQFAKQTNTNQSETKISTIY